MEETVYNNSKLAFHKSKLESFIEGNIMAPIYVRVKPTNYCNHHCFYCAYDSWNPIVKEQGRNAQLPLAKMMEILSDFKEMGIKAVTYSGGGEPLVYPHIVEALEKTLEYGIELSIITNGQKLKNQRAELLKQAQWVRVSLDSCNAQTFSKTRRVPESWFYDLTNNLKSFAMIKPTSCELGINFVVQENNKDQVYSSIKLFRELGVDHVKITPRHILETSKKDFEISKDDVTNQIEKARQEFSDFRIYDSYDNDFNLINMRTYTQCYIMQTIPVVGAVGDVYFCHDKAWRGEGVLGSIKNQSFKELWFSSETKIKFKEFNPKKECKHRCTNDSKNIIIGKILNDFNNVDLYIPSTNKHKNFI